MAIQERTPLDLAISDRVSGAMPATTLYRTLRTNGDIFIAISLAGCLVFRYWPLPPLSVYLGLLFLTSFFLSIWHSIRNYNFSLFRTYRGQYYNVKIVYTIFLLPLLAYHAEGFGELETPLKTLLVCYIVVMNTDRFRWSVLIYGAAAGAVAAFVLALFETGVYAADRSGGATNAIRFGMIALTFASICAVGLLFTRRDRIVSAVSVAGFLAGVGAAFTSGSRGALLALPFVLLLLAPVLWRRSKRVLLVVIAFFAILAGALLLSNVGRMSTRIMTAYTNISAMLTGGQAGSDRSVGDRTKLLALAWDLFKEHPVLGVGARGWNAATEQLAAAPDPADRIALAYNQAHNQYADDLAKGGMVRFLLGLLNLIAPLYLFVKCRPFADRDGSEFALAGVIVSVSFMIFCLSESLMILSLPAMVHAVLMLYLLAGCDATRTDDSPSPAVAPVQSDNMPLSTAG